MEQVDLVIRNGIVLTQDDDDRIIYDGGVAVQDGTIKAVDSSDVIARQYRARTVIDARCQAVLPGFVNTHFHFTQNFMKGTRDDYDFLDWIDKISFPRIKVTMADYRKGASDIHRLAVMHSGIDLISSGITCTSNMEWGMLPGISSAYETMGMRVINTLTLTDVDSWTPKEAIIEEDELFALASDLIDEFRTNASRVEFAYGVACPNSASSDLIVRTRREASRHGAKVHVHLAESKHEYDRFLSEKKVTPTRYLDDLGFLGGDVWAAHCVWVDSEDIDILADRKVGVAHNPKCNMKLAIGVAPVVEMMKRGIEVGIGIDSCAVSDNTDFFEAMRTMIFLHRVTTMDPKAILGKDALRMATIGGARSMGIGDVLGSLEPGKHADIQLVDLRAVNTRPYNDLVNNLVFAANSSNISCVIVGGDVLMRDGKFTRFDKDVVLDEVEREAAAMYRRAGIELPPHFAIGEQWRG